MPKTPDLSPRGWNGRTGPDALKYGASMGRPSYTGGDVIAADPPLSLQRVRLDSGGYDRGGAYWGMGDPLYWAGGEDVDIFFRAHDRDAAKAHVLNLYPAARFYR